MATQNGDNVNGNGAVHFDDVASLSYALTGGISNPQTGQGVYGSDPSRSAVINYGGWLDREQQIALFRNYGLLRKVVSNIPRAATYRWGMPTIASGSSAKVNGLIDALNQLPIYSANHTYKGAKKGFLEALKAAFLTGNCGLVMDADDGLALDQELNLKRLRSLKGLWLMNRWQLVPDTQSFSLLKQSEHFRVQDGQSLGGGTSSSQRIHRSRVLWFRGAELVDDYSSSRNQGCDDSILQSIMESFNLFLAGVQGAGRMLVDFDFYVHSIDGLLAKLEANPTKAQAAISARMAINRQRRSVNRDMVIDKNLESIAPVARTVGGYSDLLEQCKQFLLASSDYPASVLFKEFSAGLNASGLETSERQTWNETIAQAQEDKCTDNILRLCSVLCAAKNGPTQGQELKGLGWQWAVLYAPSPEENADLQSKFAGMLQTLSQVEASTIGKVGIKALWGKNEFSDNLILDQNYLEWLDKGIDYASKQDPAQQQEPDTSALQGGDQSTPPADDQQDDTEPPAENEQAQQDQSIADDILSDRTLLDSADSLRFDDSTPSKRIIDWHGFRLGLQYQPFDMRHGKVLPVAYGHIQKTKGADGMACDCYVGSNLDSDRVFEVTQLVNGQFDEHKYMLGFDNIDDAQNTFLKVMPAEMFGGIREVGLDGLAAYKLDSADSIHADDKYSHINFTPPGSVRNAFRRGLGLHEKGLTGGGLEPATVRAAKAIASGSPVTPDQVRKGYRWFARNRRFATSSKDSPAWASFMLWGSSAGDRWYGKLYRQMQAADQRTDSIHLDATRKELIAKATEKNKGLEKGKKFKTFGATNAAIAAFVGEGTAQPATTAKAAAKAKGGTKGGKYQTSKTSSAIAQAIAKKTGADPEAIEKDLRGKIQKAIDKTRKESKKAGNEPTDKELRAAARSVVKDEVKNKIAIARGEAKPESVSKDPAKAADKNAKQAKVKAEAPEGKPAEPKQKVDPTEDTYNPPSLLEAKKSLTAIGNGSNNDVFLDEKHQTVVKYGAVKQSEADIQNEAAKLGIAPKIVSQPKPLLESEIKALSVGGDSNSKSLAMEFVKGSHPSTDEEKMKALAGLLTLNKAGIAHNDYGLENVIIDKNGDAKVIDYGAADRSWKKIAKYDIGSSLGTLGIVGWGATAVDKQKHKYAKVIKEHEDFTKKLPFKTIDKKSDAEVKALVLDYLEKQQQHLQNYGITKQGTAARASVKVEARGAIASARGEGKPQAKPVESAPSKKTEKKPATEKKTRSAKPKPAEQPAAEPKAKKQRKAKAAEDKPVEAQKAEVVKPKTEAKAEEKEGGRSLKSRNLSQLKRNSLTNQTSL